jgi:hypothetical protein
MLHSASELKGTYKSLGIDKVPAELVQQGDKTLLKSYQLYLE